jgi:hypothetical protein
VVLIQLLLPCRTTQEGGTEPSPVARTREELTARFAGLTAYVRSPAKGLWTSPDGHVEHDDVIMVEIVTDVFDREWWRDYAGTLCRRFQQDAMHIRAIPVDLLDDGRGR